MFAEGPICIGTNLQHSTTPNSKDKHAGPAQHVATPYATQNRTQHNMAGHGTTNRNRGGARGAQVGLGGGGQRRNEPQKAETKATRLDTAPNSMTKARKDSMDRHNTTHSAQHNTAQHENTGHLTTPRAAAGGGMGVGGTQNSGAQRNSTAQGSIAHTGEHNASTPAPHTKAQHHMQKGTTHGTTQEHTGPRVTPRAATRRRRGGEAIAKQGNDQPHSAKAKDTRGR